MRTRKEQVFQQKMMVLLKPHSTWKFTPSIEDQEAAHKALVAAQHLLRNTPPLRSSHIREHNLFYLQELGWLYQELHAHHYINACNELEKLMHFHRVLDPAIRANVLAVVERHITI